MLNNKQRASLKSLAHPLKPIIIVGKKGITDALVLELERALNDHELVKVRFHEYDDLKEDAADLANRAGAEVVGVQGKVATLYLAHPEEPRIKL
jgi:RNA-binding protein